jgi:O-antigen/teichoic acid export membrane protein
MTENDLTRPTESVWRRLLRNAGWLLGARAINVPLALLETILLARMLGPDRYGTLAVVMATVAVLQRIFSFRMSEFVIKYLTDALEQEQLERGAATLKVAFLAEGLSSLVACGVAVLSAPFLARHFLAPDQPSTLIQLFALWAITNCIAESSTGILQVFNQFRFLAIANVTRKTLLVVALTGLFFSSGGVSEILVAYLVANLIANSVLYTGVLRQVGLRLGHDWWRAGFSEIRRMWKEMRHFALTTHLGATLSVIVRDADVLWLGFFRPEAEVGYFKLAGSLLKAPFAAGSPMTKALAPEVTRIVAQGNRFRLVGFLRRTTVFSAAWVVPISIVTAFVAPFVIRNFHGEQFLPALPALWILLVGTAVAFILFWTRPTLLALGRPGLLLNITTLSALLKIVLGLLIVPSFGYLGLATLLVSIQVFSFALHVGAVHRNTGHAQRNS